MFCRHCGIQIDPGSRFCGNCGYSTYSENIYDTKHSHISPRKKAPGWFKFLIGVALVGLFLLGLMFLTKEDIAESVEGQISALKSNQITEAYYSFTSKEFQSATPLDVFRQFVKTYPAFNLNESVSINKRQVEEGIGSIDTTLIAYDGSKTEVQYKLIREDSKWKILSIKMIDTIQENAAETASVRTALIIPIQEQLQAFRNHDFIQAYKLVSEEFAADTPIEEFVEFAKSYPVLLNFDSAEYESHTLKDNHGDVMVILHTSEGPIPAEYKMIKELGEWKIWGLKLFLLVDEPVADGATDTKPLFHVVNEQLNALLSGNIAEAYENFASKEFKNITSLEAFQDFIQRYPTFSSHSTINFQTPIVINDKGKLKVELQNDKHLTTVEYTFGREEGNWKIWGMQIDKHADVP